MLEKASAGAERNGGVKESLILSGIEKRYGDAVALQSTDLEIKAGEFVTLLGPSGSGKTTILMSIAGFVPPSAGRILLDGQDVACRPSGATSASCSRVTRSSRT